MSELDARIGAFKKLIEKQLPHRIVTREYKDLVKRDRRELKQGVYTLMCQGLPKFGKLGGSPATVKLFLLGQFVIEENDSGDQIEVHELAMVEEVSELLRVSEAGYPATPRVEAVDVALSAQMDHPYGWIAAVLEMSWTKKCTT